MRGKSLSKEMSVSELRTLRNEGLSNLMIAQRLDISAATVARYLWPMTSEERGRIMRERNFVDHDTPAQRAARIMGKPITPVLPVAAMVYEIKGALATYSVDATEGDISFTLNGNSLTIKANEVEDLVGELNRVLATMKQMDFALISMGRG